MLSPDEVELLIGCIPEFQPSNKLTVFVKVVDELMNQVEGRLTDICKVKLNDGIVTKIKGEAEEYIQYQKATDWPAIRKCLLFRYADPRSEFELITDLLQCVQKKRETLSDYHSNINGKLETLIEHFILNITDEDLLRFKQNQYRSLAAHTFKSGVLEPYRSYLRNHSEGLNSLESCFNRCQQCDKANN